MPKISILMYHQVGKFSRPTAHRATFCHIRRFRAQMAYLYYFGYEVLSLEQAIDLLYSGKDMSTKGHSVVLTFDDGYENFEKYAFPVLKKYGFPATVFLVAGLLGKSAQWLADDGRFAPDLMDVETVLRLRSHGITFGSHALTHPRLTQVDQGSLEKEIRDSKKILEDIFGEEIKYFCYPSGDYNEDVVRVVKDAGYVAALTCDRASATPSDDPFLLPRKAISFGDSLAGYFWKLHMKHKRKVKDKAVK